MNKLICYVLALTLLAGCTSATPHGQCVGLNGQKDPKKVYAYSGWNIAMGVIFFELVAPPIIVVLDELECPVADAPRQ